MSTYFVRLDGKEYAVTIGRDGAIAVDGESVTVDVQPANDHTYSVLIGNVSATVVVARTMDGYQVLLQNNQVDVHVESERNRLLRKYSQSSVSTQERYEIHSPMPALVVRIETTVGDHVREGQGLVILEAMKMENEIKSHRTGTVKVIHVVNGKTVEKGQLLITIE